MEAVSFGEAQRSLASIIEKVCLNCRPLKIVRDDGQNVVLVPLAEYESLQETMYLLGNQTNARRLLDAIDSLEGRTPTMT